MAALIKKEDILESAEIQKALKDLLDMLNKVADAGKSATKALTLNDISKEAEANANATKELEKAKADLKKIMDKLAAVYSNENIALAAGKEELKKANAAVSEAITGKKKLAQASKDKAEADKKEALALSRQVGSYNQLSDELNELIRSYKAYTQAQRDDVLIGGAQLKKIQSLDTQLKQLDATMGRSQRNVGNYKSGFNGLNFSMLQVGRELPSLAYGFSTFVGAISNNIPMVTDEITKARKELALLHEKGEKGVPIWKQLMGAVFSWQTALVVGLTVLTMYGREIAEAARGLFKFQSATKLSREEIKSLNEEMSKSIGSDLGKLDLLFTKLKQVGSQTEEYNSIKNEIIDNYGEYLNGLDSETSSLNNVAEAYTAIRDAILEKVKAQSLSKVYEDQAAILQQKTIENYEEIRKGFIKAFGNNDADKYFSKFRDEFEQTGKVSEATMLLFEKANAALYATSPNYKIATDALNNIKDAQSDYNLKTKDAEKLIGAILGTNTKNNKSLIEEYENKLKIAKLKPESTKEQIRAKNIEIKAIEDEIKALKELGIEKIKKAKKDKSPKTVKDFKYDIQGDDEADQRILNALLLKAEKDLSKELYNERKKRTEDAISDSLAFADEEKLLAQESTLEKIKAAKGSKDAIIDIQHELTMFMIDEDIKAQQRIIDTANLEPDAYAEASVRLRKLRLQRGEEELQYTDQTEQEKERKRNETLRSMGEAVNEGFNFSQQIFANQADAAKKRYDDELKAAGDSVEGKIIAERKYEAESLKIRRKQAIADKLQAAFNIGLTLATATAKINVFQVVAATLALAAVMAKPIPAYFKGKDGTPATFIAGDTPDGKGASEMIIKPTGEMLLTPDKATLFSDKSFIGSTVIPHDKTQQMLASYAMTQGSQIFVDMGKTNTTLSSIDSTLKKGGETRFVNANGNTVVRKGNTTTILV